MGMDLYQAPGYFVICGYLSVVERYASRLLTMYLIVSQPELYL